MRSRLVTLMVLAFVLTGVAGVPHATAQEPPKDSQPQIKPMDSYKLELTVDELDGGKKINSRSYSMRMRASATPEWSGWEQVRVGSRVPVAVEANKFEYVDVGMNIDCRLMPIGNSNVVLAARWGYSSLEGGRMVSPSTQNPMVRQVRSDMESVVPLDKPTVISEVDDVASTHRYVFEVKVMKITP